MATALSRQLRRQSHQRSAAVFQAVHGLRPDDRQRHLPRRVPGTRHSIAGRAISTKAPTPATLRNSLATRFGFCWIHPPYWRQKLYTDDPRDLSRTPTLDAFLERYRLLIGNCAGALSRRQARHPDGRLQRPRGRLRPPRLPHQADRLRVRPEAALDRHHPLQPRSQQRQEGLSHRPSSPACTTCA